VPTLVPEAELPRFSVVVPAYNAEETLGETLDALLAQEFDDWECIVVDDGSGDGTLELARRYGYRDGRIQAIHQDNSGTAGAYNTGVRAARGPFAVICSADDILLPRHLATFAELIDANPQYDIYSSNGYYWRPGVDRHLVYQDARSRTQHSRELAEVIRLCFYSVGATYRRELFDKVGGYRLGVFGEDYDFWLRSMAVGARRLDVPEPLSAFRLSANQKSARLETVYLSDIRLVSELQATHSLTAEEQRSVRWTIHDRLRLIDEIHNPALQGFRSRVEPIAVSLLGRRVARRGWHVVRGAFRAIARINPRSPNAR